MARHEDDRHISINIDYVSQQPESVHARKLDVAYDDRRHPRLDTGDDTLGRLERLDREAGELQRLFAPMRTATSSSMKRTLIASCVDSFPFPTRVLCANSAPPPGSFAATSEPPNSRRCPLKSRVPARGPRLAPSSWRTARTAAAENRPRFPDPCREPRSKPCRPARVRPFPRAADRCLFHRVERVDHQIHQYLLQPVASPTPLTSSAARSCDSTTCSLRSKCSFEKSRIARLRGAPAPAELRGGFPRERLELTGDLSHPLRQLRMSVEVLLHVVAPISFAAALGVIRKRAQRREGLVQFVRDPGPICPRSPSFPRESALPALAQHQLGALPFDNLAGSCSLAARDRSFVPPPCARVDRAPAVMPPSRQGSREWLAAVASRYTESRRRNPAQRLPPHPCSAPELRPERDPRGPSRPSRVWSIVRVCARSLFPSSVMMRTPAPKPCFSASAIRSNVAPSYCRVAWNVTIVSGEIGRRS